MGLSLYETDRLLGHVSTNQSGKKAAKTQSIDLNNPETQAAIAEKMERYIFDPRFSLNPACKPIRLSEAKKRNLIEFSEYTITNDTPERKTLQLNLTGAETGESISIEMPNDTVNQLQIISNSKSWENCNRLVIGNTAIYQEV